MDLKYKFGYYPKDTIWAIAEWIEDNIPTFYEVNFRNRNEATITAYELNEEFADELDEFEQGLQHLRLD